MSKSRPPGAWSGLLPHGSGSSELSSLSQGFPLTACFRQLLGTCCQRSLTSASPIAAPLSPEGALQRRLWLQLSFVELGLWPMLMSVSAEGAASVEWLLFVSDHLIVFFSSISLEFWFYWVSLHVCCFKLITVPCWDIFQLYRNWLIWALEGCHWKNMCTCFCVLIGIERLVVINHCFFPIKFLF